MPPRRHCRPRRRCACYGGRDAVGIRGDRSGGRVHAAAARVAQRPHDVQGERVDPKMQALLARTNVTELVAPAAVEQVTDQPVRPEPPPTQRPLHSTSDPFQYHLATTEIVGKLQDRRTKPALRVFGWFAFGLPMAVFGVLLLQLTWYDSALQAWKIPHSAGQALRALFGSACALAFMAAYPYFTRRRGSGSA